MLEIKYRLTSELIGYVNNSRTHSDDQVAQISASIKEFGFTNPLLLDESSGIIAGHGRLLAAKKLSMDEVPTITLVGLTDIQRKAYVIADNKLALNAGWDDELLALELKSLQGEDFDLSLIGFDVDELALLLEPEEADFSDKNKELDLNDFDDEMQMKFNLSKDQYDFISERLGNINESKEIALLKVLNYEP
jgi:ParB-like chromosome segregation protein Spo0J